METNRTQDLFHIHARLGEAINRETLAIVGEDAMREFALSYSEDTAPAEALLDIGARYEDGQVDRQDVVDACLAVIESWKQAARLFVDARRTEQAPRKVARR